MAKVTKRTFSLTAEQADFIEQKVTSGQYASSSEVIRAGLRAMQERDAAVERWLRDEVVPAFDEMQAHPELAVSASDVRAEMRREFARLSKAAE